MIQLLIANAVLKHGDAQLERPLSKSGTAENSIQLSQQAAWNTTAIVAESLF
jgi:hypothetical protein